MGINEPFPQPPPVTHTDGSLPRAVEADAERIYGPDFLGKIAIANMQELCRAVGIDVVFETNGIDLPLSRQRLEEIKSQRAEERAEDRRRISMRPKSMLITGTDGVPTREAVNIVNLLRLFSGKKNPFGHGPLFDTKTWGNDLCKGAQFMTESLPPGYVATIKRLMYLGENYTHVDNNLRNDPDKPTAFRVPSMIEMVWDELLARSAGIETPGQGSEQFFLWSSSRTRLPRSEVVFTLLDKSPEGLHIRGAAADHVNKNLAVQCIRDLKS